MSQPALRWIGLADSLTAPDAHCQGTFADELFRAACHHLTCLPFTNYFLLVVLTWGPLYKARHLRVRFIVQDTVKRVIQRLLAAGFVLLEYRKRVRGDRFSNNPDAGVDGGNLNDSSCIDAFPGQALPKEKVVAALTASWGLSLARNRKRKGIFIVDLLLFEVF